MKRNTLSTAVLAGIGGVAGLAGIANAVNLNPDGLGEVLIFPYYTVNGGNDTLLSVVNTTDTVKAVKVRFVDSKNSVEVLDFNLYLSPFDVWVGALTDPEGDDSGPAVLRTADDSCTVPRFTKQPGAISSDVAFRTLLFGTGPEDQPGFDVDISLERTREGHFEMIEMGVVDETVDLDSTGLEAAAIHNPLTDVPDTGPGDSLDCNDMVDAWIIGPWNLQTPGVGTLGSRGPDTDVRSPEGGLFGGASIINVAKGTQVSYNADAIDSFYDPDPLAAGAPLTLHFEPGSTQPTLNQADTGDGATVTSIVFNRGQIVTSDWSIVAGTTAGRVDAVSAVYMHDQIYNEYAADVALNAATEWVTTFPTKRFYVNNEPSPAYLPFTVNFNDDDVADGAACEPVGLGIFNREERDPGIQIGDVDFSPRPVVGVNVPVICYEAQVITFGQDLVASGGVSSLLGSPTASNFPLDTVAGDTFQNGWAIIDFTTNVATSTIPPACTDDHVLCDAGMPQNLYRGLPVTGFAVQVVTNNAPVPGSNALANYAGLFGHRASRSIVGS